MPEPNKNTAPEAHKAWRLGRARAMKILYSTLKGEGVMKRLHSSRHVGDVQDYRGYCRDPAYVLQRVVDIFGVEAGCGIM